MKLRFSLMTLALTAGLSFGLSSCTEEENPLVPTVGVPSDVMINTLDANQITAKWTRSADDLGGDTLIVTDKATGIESKAIAFAGTSSATVNGLSAGKLYDVQVASEGGRTVAIEWATAARSGKIKLWETSGTGAGQPSGLIIGPSTHGAVAAALSVNAADNALIDIVLATDPAVPTSNISLQSAHIEGYYVSGGLDNDYYTSGFGGRITTKGYYDQFALAPNNMSAVCLVRTETGYYARVEIVPQADGKLWNVDASNNRSIDVIVSYQSIVNKPYASRPIGKRVRGVSAPKRAEDAAIGVIKNVQ
jgi:hypothetical protein